MTSQRVKLKDQILDGIARSVKEVQAYSFSSDGEVVKVSNEARPLQRLVEHLDHAFLHGLKHVTPGYWVFVRRFTHKLVISDIMGLDRLATDLGRSRAWLYQSLNEGALESYFRCFQGNEEVLKKFYIEHALMRDSERLTLLMTLVSGLDFVTFDLELNVAYFDLVSHIPRSASDPRDLDDTVSIHSSMSIESATSSVVNDLDAHYLLGVEGGLSCEGSPKDVLQSRLSVDESSVKVCFDDIKEEDDQTPGSRDDNEQDAKDHGALGNPTEDSSSTCNPSGTESHETDDTNEVTRPLTLDLAAQSNNNSSNELKHVTRNYSTPDFDINMEKVAEQDQNLEVIRIRKKARKKKKKRKSSKNDVNPVLKLQDPRRGRRRDRSSSPSNVSIASSCIEESELEDKEGCLGVEGGEGSNSSTTNLSECSAVEGDVDCGTVLASSLPESENMTPVCGNGTMPNNLAQDRKDSTQVVYGESEEKNDRKNVLEDCSEIVTDIPDSVCRETKQPVPTVENVDIPIEQFQNAVQVTTDTAKLRLPSFADPVMHDSFNSSVDGIDQSIIYWQADITDNSFDADVTSSTPAKSGCRVSIQHDHGDVGEDDDVFVQESATVGGGRDTAEESSKCGIRQCGKAGSGENGSHNSSKHNCDKQQPRQRTISGTLEYDRTISVELTQKTDIPSSVSDLPAGPDSGTCINQSFVQSSLSAGIATCSSDSLSSGIGSNPDTNTTNTSSSCTPSTPAADSDYSTSEASSHSKKDDSWYCSRLSLVQSVEEDDDGFVLVDVVDKNNVLGERSQGDGKDASMDPLCAVDVNANSGGGPAETVTVGTYDFDFDEDGEKVTTHDAEMKVDNNLKLYLMLEIFKIEDEKYNKLIRLSTGHMEGNLLPAFILLTDLAIYILRRGERNGRFSTESRTLYHDLDYVLIGLNYQSVQLVCKNRRKHFWLTTGSHSLTRFFLHSLREVMMMGSHAESLCVLTDATAQAIGLKKYVTGEEKVEMSEVRVHLYTLVHWEDLLDSNTAADLQLYIPATKRKGMLHYKTKESFFVGRYWKAAFFKLKQNVLKRYPRKDSEEPDLIIDLGSQKFGGCRRIHSDRRFSFELVFTNGSQPLQLSCENELQLSHWLQSICEVASHQHSISQMKGTQPNPCQPSCAVITSRSVLLCLEDYQTHFFRTLARTDLGSISRVERSQSNLSYLVMNFKNTECDNPWLLYFNCSKELDKFVSHLSVAFQERTEKDLKIRSIEDEKLAKRCSDCQELILSAWQRSDSLGRGRVRGDSW